MKLRQNIFLYKYNSALILKFLLLFLKKVVKNLPFYHLFRYFKRALSLFFCPATEPNDLQTSVLLPTISQHRFAFGSSCFLYLVRKHLQFVRRLTGAFAFLLSSYRAQRLANFGTPSYDKSTSIRL